MALRRIGAFLQRSELQSYPSSIVKSDSDTASDAVHAVKTMQHSDASDSSDSSIVIENGEYRWDSDEEHPTLQNINLNIKKGELVAIIGSVGKPTLRELK